MSRAGFRMQLHGEGAVKLHSTQPRRQEGLIFLIVQISCDALQDQLKSIFSLKKDRFQYKCVNNG